MTKSAQRKKNKWDKNRNHCNIVNYNINLKPECFSRLFSNE